MRVAYPYLFDFSASQVGGGLKRLHEYARWFDAHGGASFMVHTGSESLRDEFPRNRFFVVRRTIVNRMLDDFGPVREALTSLGSVPDCYYSYGIPLYQRVGRVNWFHVSNVLPLFRRNVPLTLRARVRLMLLGRRIRRGLRYADVISAESNSSLALLDPEYRDRLFLSVNGSDDELASVGNAQPPAKEPVATVVGTYPHKTLAETYRVFRMLKAKDGRLKLVIFGEANSVPTLLQRDPDVVVKGSRPRTEVIDQLRRSKYYISTTTIENSYNAAAEGIFLADESYISDIGPHRELLTGMPHDRFMMPESGPVLLHVARSQLSGLNLKSWDDVVCAMNARIDASVSTTLQRGKA
jgi:hypothetical protein